MRNKLMLMGVGIVIGALLVTVGIALAGSLDPIAGPSYAGSQMYTLEQIYHRLNTGAAATKMTSFTEPSAGPGSTMHTLDEIYALAGSRAFVPKTGILFGDPGSDGNLKKGVAWPNPRFTDNSNGTVTDNLTGLTWLKNANCFGTQTYASALTFSNSLYDGWTGDGSGGDCGLSDSSTAGQWRLANMRELQSLLNYQYYAPALPNTAGTGQWSAGDPFTGVQVTTSNMYWTSTLYSEWGGTASWSVDLYGGIVNWENPANTHYVWPVRGGQ
jgi:hypothetical protein